MTSFYNFYLVVVQSYEHTASLTLSNAKERYLIMLTCMVVWTTTFFLFCFQIRYL